MITHSICVGSFALWFLWAHAYRMVTVPSDNHAWMFMVVWLLAPGESRVFIQTTFLIVVRGTGTLVILGAAPETYCILDAPFVPCTTPRILLALNLLTLLFGASRFTA